MVYALLADKAATTSRPDTPKGRMVRWLLPAVALPAVSSGASA
jgi:hypothetical protein